MSDDPLLQSNSWLYHLGDVSGSNIEAVANSGADLLVIEYAHYEDGETPYTANDLATMRGTDDKLIISYLSIGEAESYRFYWDMPEFQSISERIIAEENPEWEENYKIRYWDKDWQNIIFDYVDRIIGAGFDGIYLDIIDAFYYWEERDPSGDIDYRQEMVDFVAAIDAHIDEQFINVKRKHPFYIIGQNGEELIENETYLNAIDGIGREDVQFYYDNTRPEDFILYGAGDVDFTVDLLEQAVDAGKKVFVVEYLNKAQQETHDGTLDTLAARLWHKGIPLYVAENRSLDAAFDQPDGVKFSRLISGTTNDDVLRGKAYGDIIDAQDGNDTVWAGKDDRGDDVIAGGAGNDILGGGAGDDLLIGDNVSDGNKFQLFSTNPDLTPSGNDTLFGGTGNDTLLGGAWKDGLVTDNGTFDVGEQLQDGTASNTLWGGDGYDIIYGAAGGDLLGGSKGGDSLYGGAGADTLFGADGNDALYGEAGNEIIYNGTGTDTIDAGAGDDTLYGGPGNDTFFGNDGKDLFFFSATSGDDVIKDFNLTDDTIDLSGTNAFTTLAEVKAATLEFAKDGQAGLLISFADQSVFIGGLELTQFDDITINI